MFGRKQAPVETAPEVSGDPSTGKGRPTPSRKEAEAARKQSLRLPKDPKAAKKAAAAPATVSKATTPPKKG